jgi:hypothetical protein
MFRFKTVQEFQLTMGVRLEPPRRYFEGFHCLNDLKTLFLARKEADASGQRRSQAVQETELNSVDAFVDFLKGVLRIDKD